MDLSEMTYKDYRNKFPSEHEADIAFGSLSEEEARGLIERSREDSYMKHFRMNFWKRQHRILTKETWVTGEMTEEFHEDWTLEEYKEIIRICLMDYCTWPEYWDDPERVKKQVEAEDAYIREAYSDHETPMSAAAEVGFACG